MDSFKTFYKEINEKLITFNNKRPKYGQIVILAGGGGSGKGFIKDELLGIDGKTFDVDALKELVLKSNLYAQKVKDEFGYDVKQLDLKNQKDVSVLHNIVSQLKISNKQQQNMFSSIMLTPEDRKPNLIFDVTLKDIKKLIQISENVQELGYDRENIHIVWVVNSVETALKQNSERDRQVNPDILKDTHRGVSNTIRTLISDSDMLQRYMNGDFWIVFNNRFMNDVVKTISGKGGSYIKDAYYVKLKRSGSAVQPLENISNEVIQKIKSYVPDQKNWD